MYVIKYHLKHSKHIFFPSFFPILRFDFYLRSPESTQIKFYALTIIGSVLQLTTVEGTTRTRATNERHTKS